MTDPSDRTAPLVWVVTDGKVGIVNQAVGLAEATGFPFIEKVIALRAPWRWLPANIWPPGLRGTSAEGDQLTPPWPDMVISCGRQSIGPARAIKAKSGAFHVHIQHPRMSLLSFDLLVVPEHDCLTGDNVVATRGAIHRITPTRLAEAAKTFAPMLAGLPRPLIAVLIGGGSRAHQLTPTLTRDIAARLRTFAAETGGGLAVTASRRTGADNEAILRAQLSGDNALQNSLLTQSASDSQKVVTWAGLSQYPPDPQSVSSGQSPSESQNMVQYLEPPEPLQRPVWQSGCWSHCSPKPPGPGGIQIPYVQGS